MISHENLHISMAISGTEEVPTHIQGLNFREYPHNSYGLKHGGQCLEGDHLRRAIRWTKEGFTWEADRKYVKLLTKELGLEGAKGVDTPSSKLTGAGCRTSDKPLDAAEAPRFRHLAGTALYLSLDRPSIQYALSEITAGMAKPCEIHMLRLKRLGRYLLKFPTETWLFALQEEPEEFQVYTDSDWESDAVYAQINVLPHGAIW